MANTYIQKRNEIVGNKIAEAFNKRHFEAYYVNTKEEALKKAIELIPQDKTISWGGSMSIEEIGLINYLKENNYPVIDRATAKNAEEKMAMYKQALTCGTFLMSANAISEDGQLINVDCIGNRIGALIFGPDNVIVVVGVNKAMPTVEEAQKRAREYAAPVNMQKISALSGRQTPCVITGKCQDCKSTDSICSNIVITRLCYPAKRIKVIVVGENLGF